MSHKPAPDTARTETEPEVPPFPVVPILASTVVIVAIALGLYFGLMRDSGEQPGNGKPEFPGPESIAELQLKGQRPDGASSWAAIEVPAEPQFTPEIVAHGKELFGKACAGCHGAQGKGDGPVPPRYDFVSRPADLSMPSASVKIRSTLLGSVPRDADLFRTITRGMPGTAMWSYRELPAAERWALVAYVKTLSPEYGASEPDAVAIPAKLPRSPELLNAGEAMFTKTCANCHGSNATGPASPMRNPETNRPYTGIAWARKGGAEMLGGNAEDDFARTLLAGFHRHSPMLSFKVYFYGSSHPNEQQQADGDRILWGTVYYCRDLLKR